MKNLKVNIINLGRKLRVRNDGYVCDINFPDIRYFKISETGIDILLFLSKHSNASLTDVTKSLARDYNAPIAHLKSDITRFLNDIYDKKLITKEMIENLLSN